MNLEVSSLPQKIFKATEIKKRPSWFADILVLTKLRVNLLVVGTAFVGFALNADIVFNWYLLINTLI